MNYQTKKTTMVMKKNATKLAPSNFPKRLQSAFIADFQCKLPFIKFFLGLQLFSRKLTFYSVFPWKYCFLNSFFLYFTFIDSAMHQECVFCCLWCVKKIKITPQIFVSFQSAFNADSQSTTKMLKKPPKCNYSRLHSSS